MELKIMDKYAYSSFLFIVFVAPGILKKHYLSWRRQLWIIYWHWYKINIWNTSVEYETVIQKCCTGSFVCLWAKYILKLILFVDTLIYL